MNFSFFFLPYMTCISLLLKVTTNTQVTKCINLKVEARLKFLAQEANNLISFYRNECTYALRVSYGYRWTTVLAGNKITEVQIVWNHTKFSVRHFPSYLYTNLSIKRQKIPNL